MRVDNLASSKSKVPAMERGHLARWACRDRLRAAPPELGCTARGSRAFADSKPLGRHQRVLS
eukprot:3936759-Alexandrium_andersonii.AAC.1